MKHVHKTAARSYELALALIVEGKSEFYMIRREKWPMLGGRVLMSGDLARARSEVPDKVKYLLGHCGILQKTTPFFIRQFHFDQCIRLLYIVEVGRLSVAAHTFVVHTTVPIRCSGAQEDLIKKVEEISLGDIEESKLYYRTP